MADNLFNAVYNPDVLSCLANLSNDEVFTPPDIVNQMLDMLPQELFRNPDTTFLDIFLYNIVLTNKCKYNGYRYLSYALIWVFLFFLTYLICFTVLVFSFYY